MIFGKFLMRFDIVEADAEDLCIDFLECENVVAELTGFCSTARRLIFGVKVEYDPLIPIVFK